MEITKSLLLTIIIIVEVIGYVLVVWIVHLLPIDYLERILVGYGLFALIITVGTCITLTEIRE